MNSEEVLYLEYLERLRTKLIAKYDELGLRASGNFEESLERQVKKNTLTLWGAYHSQFMEDGRDSGGFPPIKRIEDWIEVKRGLPDAFKENKRQFAFIIARKIAEEGITVPNKYNKGEIISAVVNNFLAKDIYEMLEKLGVLWSSRITSDVVQLLKAA